MKGNLIEILLMEDNPVDLRLKQEALRNGKVRKSLHVGWCGIEALA